MPSLIEVESEVLRPAGLSVDCSSCDSENIEEVIKRPAATYLRKLGQQSVIRFVTLAEQLA